jgi:hypothetical protein
MKILFLILGEMFMAAGVFAQGYVSLANNSSLLVLTNGGVSSQFGWGNDSASAGAGEAPNTTAYLLAVLVQPYDGTITTDTNVWDGSWSFTGLITSNLQSGTAGRIAPLLNVQANNWPAGVTNQVIIVGWSVNMGSTWNDVSNLIIAAEALGGFGWFVGSELPVDAPVYFGVSSVGFISASPSGFGFSIWSASGPTVYGNPISSGFTLYDLPLTINAVPEPSMITLACFGGLSLLLFRRRR